MNRSNLITGYGLLFVAVYSRHCQEKSLEEWKLTSNEVWVQKFGRCVGVAMTREILAVFCSDRLFLNNELSSNVHFHQYSCFQFPTINWTGNLELYTTGVSKIIRVLPFWMVIHCKDMFRQ